ncbi:hypothetical protein [Paraflavitalea speifideaquila]|uniref:hypothetical protein n=1 Tax=Paraflavitalea speifideaquila TaxID=3076558 RepID=UPI0028E5D6B6|nr:hypothetical protein [Paraflavitalea speifideiaquila]
MANYNFENTNVFSQTIPGWSTANTAAADYVQSLSHGNNEECALLSPVSVSNGIFSFTANKNPLALYSFPLPRPPPHH